MIVSLRNPIDRAYSAFSFLRATRREPLADFGSALDEEESRTAAGVGPDLAVHSRRDSTDATSRTSSSWSAPGTRAHRLVRGPRERPIGHAGRGARVPRLRSDRTVGSRAGQRCCPAPPAGRQPHPPSVDEAPAGRSLDWCRPRPSNGRASPELELPAPTSDGIGWSALDGELSGDVTHQMPRAIAHVERGLEDLAVRPSTSSRDADRAFDRFVATDRATVRVRLPRWRRCGPRSAGHHRDQADRAEAWRRSARWACRP